MVESSAPPESARLRFQRFVAEDAAGLAEILADPEVARNITVNVSTPERGLACARDRIAWHNGSWQERGYGAWALRAREASLAAPDRLLGWCGFTPPDLEGEDPEILYGLARGVWRLGLAQEAARAAIDWFFANTPHQGVSAIVFAALNPASVQVMARLGMTHRGTMDFKDFVPDAERMRDVLDYEVWRLGAGAGGDPELLLWQAPFRAGQIAATGIAPAEAIESALCRSIAGQACYAALEDPEARVRTAFREGMAQSHMDWYHLSRSAWTS